VIAVQKRILSLLLMLVLVLALGLAPAALAADSADIRVAVIDTGVSTAAVDAGRIAPGLNYIRPQDDTGDKLGHGTAVSAIIVGSENARITGICPSATLVPLVVASQDEEGNTVQGDTAMTAQAIYAAVDVYDCRIINISSGAALDSYALRGAVSYAERKGVLVVSCAGNNQKTNPGAVYYPGGYDSVLCVGAATDTGAVATFSQQNDTVDLLARGTGLRIASVKGTAIRGYGTSYATAIVTGAAAQIWMNHPDLTADEVRQAVLSSTRNVDGWKVFDLDAALKWSPDTGFSDVVRGDWFHDSVLWAVEEGITAGTSATTFSPERTCTYGEILTFLWKSQGCPKPNIANPYRSPAVGRGEYYDAPFLWAWETGVVTDPELAPGGYCSRGDVVTFLWRLAGEPDAERSAFADVAAGAPYRRAVDWAVANGVTAGTSATTFSPHMTCTRAQIVTFLFHCFAA